MVYAEAVQLYRALALDRPRIRLVGVKAENLRPAGEATQLALDLFGDQPAGRAPARPTGPIDALTARFGEAVVRPASLLGAGRRRVGGRFQPLDGPARRLTGTSGDNESITSPQSNPCR